MADGFAQVTATGRQNVFVPQTEVAVRQTVYVPADANEWIGFWEVEFDPSPKSQNQEEGPLVERSLKLTLRAVVAKLKLLTGATQLTVTVSQDVLDPQAFTAVKQTV